MSRVTPDEIFEGGARILRWRGTPLPGKVLVFLHGLGDGADIWRPVINAWPEGPITAVALDFPGHGGSEFQEVRDYTVPKFAAWVANVLASFGIQNPILIGHSLGGRVALEASFSGVISPSHVTIVDVSPDPKDGDEVDNKIEAHLQLLAQAAPSMASFRQKIAANMPLADATILAETFPHLVAANKDSDQRSVCLRLDPEIRQLLNAPLKVDGWAALEALGCPGTIIRGMFSSVLDVADALKMYQRLRQPSGNLTIPKAGHAIALEQPAALAKAIAKGLRGGV